MRLKYEFNDDETLKFSKEMVNCGLKLIDSYESKICTCSLNCKCFRCLHVLDLKSTVFKYETRIEIINKKIALAEIEKINSVMPITQLNKKKDNKI